MTRPMKTSSQSNCSGAGPLEHPFTLDGCDTIAPYSQPHIFGYLNIFGFLIFGFLDTWIFGCLRHNSALFTVTYLCRIDDKEEAAEYGIESFPAMVYFDKVG